METRISETISHRITRLHRRISLRYIYNKSRYYCQ